MFRERIERRIHPSLGGIALGSVGLASTFRDLCKIHSQIPDDVQYVSLFLNVFSVCCACGVCLRAVVCRDLFMEEMKYPASTSAYGSLVMAIALIFKDLAEISDEVREFERLSPIPEHKQQQQGTFWYGLAEAGIYIAGILQFIVMVVFFETCYRTSTLPEPFWFPPTVSLAMTGWSGVSVGMNRELVELTFWGGIVLCILILPVAIVRNLTLLSRTLHTKLEPYTTGTCVYGQKNCLASFDCDSSGSSIVSHSLVVRYWRFRLDHQ